MYRRGGVIALVALALAAPAAAQAPQPKDEPTAKPPASSRDDERPRKPRPRVTLKPQGGTGTNVGDDAAGGGATSGVTSKGGNAGTPSGSFTGPASKP
jgi:hypothetical protein